MNVFSRTSQPLRGLSTALIAGGLLLVSSAAHADIKYTKSTKIGDDQKVMSQITTYVKDGFERTETTTEYSPAKMTDIALTLCDKQQNVRINPSLKIYTVSSLNGSTSSAKGGSNTGDKTDKNGGQKTGKITMTSTVKDLGEETIAGFKTRHYMLTSKMQMSGCAGDGETNTKMEIWVADIRDAVACKDSSPVDYTAMAGGTKPDCKIEFEHKGDVEAYTKAYQGLIMRMKMYNGDKVMMVQEVTMLSQAKLGDDLFAIPADYREVDAEEFQKKQSEAMMQAIMKQAQGGGNAGGDQNANDDNNDGGNNDGNDDGEANGNNDDEENEDKGEEEPAPKPKKKRKLGGFKLPF